MRFAWLVSLLCLWTPPGHAGPTTDSPSSTPSTPVSPWTVHRPRTLSPALAPLILPAQKQRQRHGAVGFVGQREQQQSRSWPSAKRTVQGIVCFFARHGLWPRYPQRMAQEVQEGSRHLFAMDDVQVRIYCQPQPQPQYPPPQFPPFGVCCEVPVGGGGGSVQPPRTTTTVAPNYEYEYYTGTGEGSYTGAEGDYGYDYGNYRARQQRRRKAKGAGGEGQGRTEEVQVQTPGGSRRKRNIRSVRDKDTVVSFAERWQRKKEELKARDIFRRN